MKLGSLFDGLYLVSEVGELYSTRTGKWLKPSTDRYGYLYYVISINGERHTIKPHRAVAECFIPNPNNKPTVDHINGNRKDNDVCNLRWATWEEQQSNDITKAKANEVHKHTDYKAMGAIRNFGRKKIKAVDALGIEYIFDSLKIASESLGINMSKASMCANGKRKTTGGYRLCYV